MGITKTFFLWKCYFIYIVIWTIDYELCPISILDTQNIWIGPTTSTKVNVTAASIVITKSGKSAKIINTCWKLSQKHKSNKTHSKPAQRVVKQ